MWYLNINNLFHLLSSVVWIGGMIYFTFVLLPSLQNISGIERAKIIGSASKRFSLIAWHCIALLLITGLIRAPHKLMFNISIHYGLILTIKHIFVILAIIFTILWSRHINKYYKPIVRGVQSDLSTDYQQVELKLRFLSSVNMIIGIAILLTIFLFNLRF